ncbi:MAG TPA: carbonic anhydrase [Labilithrix sp.]|nr:carbonic anhydrase [Labilithrix sp.]
MTLAALLLSPATALAETDPGAPSPEEASSLLVAGNERFAHGTSKHPHQSAKRVAETSAGQHPFVTVLSCSDSRVPPELLFDEGLGDVFSVRVEGNVASADEMGSVEYGVDHLGTPLLVVLGHTKCGAVTAAASHVAVHGHLGALVAKVGTAVDAARAKMPHASDAEIVPEAIKGNVFETMATMLRESDAIRERVDSGKTRMIGAVYDISTGSVTWLGPHPEQTSIVEKAKASAPAGHGGHGGKDKDKDKGEHGDKKGAHGDASHDAPKHDAPKHGDADGGADQAHASHGTPDPAPLPVPSPPPPIAFAVVALLCTLGGGISGRLSK